MKILLTEPLIEPVDSQGIKIMEEVGEVKVASEPSEDCLIREARDVDALVVRLANVSSKVIENAKRLKVIARTGVGVDNIDVKSATEKGIMVVNLPVMNTDSVAEHVICLTLALAKNLTVFDKEMRKGNWAARDQLLERNIEIKGKTLGIVGLGAIGVAVAHRAKALNMRVIYYSRRRKIEVEERLEIEYLDLNTLLAQSDFITVHVALTKETRHLFGQREFRLMKERAYFVNTSRGSVVDQEALFGALEKGWIAGAALDVFEEEPPAQNFTGLGLRNLILTPHVAGFTKDARERMIITLARDVVEVLRGGLPKNLVNKEVLDKRNNVEINYDQNT